MADYYVNKIAQSNGDYEVHKTGCSYMPSSTNREYLGDFSNCGDAVKKAKEKGYSKANGCYYCSNACHTS